MKEEIKKAIEYMHENSYRGDSYLPICNALQEHLDRENGCETCNDIDLSAIDYISYAPYSKLSTGEAKCCPNCGRTLKALRGKE